MTIAVHDASILIDLIGIGLIEQAFALEYRMVTTDFIIAELRAEQQNALRAFISNGTLTVDSADAETVAEIAALFEQHKALSFADCSVLLRARQLSAILLTGDKRLRTTAADSQLEVHGVLWIIEQLVERKIIPARTATARIEALIHLNGRLPIDECRKLLKRWS